MTNVLNHGTTDVPQKEPPALTVEFSCTGPRWVLTLKGELNGSSIAAVEVQIDKIGCSECKDVVLDVTGLTTLDPVGTRVLEGLGHYVRALGARLTVTGASGQVAEALRPTRLGLGRIPGGVEDGASVSYPRHFSRHGSRPFASPNFLP